MKFINSVMADYIKPFISDQKGTKSGFKEKFEQKEEEKPIPRSGMGDFDYESFPLVAIRENMSDKDLLDHFSKLFVSMDNEIAENFEEQKNLEDKLDTIEKEIKKRKYLYDMCLEICNKQSVELEKYSEKNKKIDSTIVYLQQMIDSWQCLIDDFRKIPEECE